MESPPSRLNELDQRIVAALQVDGRASWRRIAAALAEPERTVARRGARLLSSQAVVVHGYAPRGEMVLLRLRCAPGTVRVAATTVARRADTTFTYVITGPADCVAEISCPPHRLEALLLDELPGIPGLSSSSTDPVLRYYRAVHEWRGGLLDDATVAALTDSPPITPKPAVPAESQHREERLLAHLLAEDGRRTNEELAVRSGLSEPTVRRRIDAMRRDGRLYVRAVVEPALLGLPVEALLWAKVPPRHTDGVGAALLASPAVRYAASIAGEYQLLVHLAVPDTVALHEFVANGPWADKVDAVHTSMLVSAPKRTSILHPALRDEV